MLLWFIALCGFCVTVKDIYRCLYSPSPTRNLSFYGSFRGWRFSRGLSMLLLVVPAYAQTG